MRSIIYSHRGVRGIGRLLLVLTLVTCGGAPLLADDAESEGWSEWVIEPPFAFNRTDRYEPPDFEAFFPDDAEGGRQLDLLIEGRLEVESVDERLAIVRRGLRNTSHHRTTLLGSVGNSYIWGEDEQDPRAIELMYHASVGTDSGVAYTALYHGPTVVSDRTPNLVRMLMEQYQSLDGQMQRRIAWGMQTYGEQAQSRTLLLDLLDQHEHLDADTVAAAIDTYREVFEAPPPDLDRFESLGLWVIAFHRDDVSAHHPRAEGIFREMLAAPFRGREDRLVEFVTRVDGGHETAVALVQGVGPRDDVAARLTRDTRCTIDFNELLSPRTLQERRLREFGRHLPGGVPEFARPAYTRPPLDAEYAHLAEEFIAPDYESFFPDDANAAVQLDAVYAQQESIELTDRELLDLFRRGLRRSQNSPNALFGWISFALGWPVDPLRTEILYQALDPTAPSEVQQYAIYYGFGLGQPKTDNFLEAMYRVYMAPPVDDTLESTRGRILWGVRDHEDDRQYLADRFAEALRNHAILSDEAFVAADNAYRELTESEPPNSGDYADRGIYLVVCQEAENRPLTETRRRIEQRLGESEHLIDIVCVAADGETLILVAVQGAVGRHWLIETVQHDSALRVHFVHLLTEDLIDRAENDLLEDFRKHIE